MPSYLEEHLIKQKILWLSVGRVLEFEYLLYGGFSIHLSPTTLEQYEIPTNIISKVIGVHGLTYTLPIVPGAINKRVERKAQVEF